MVRKIIHMRNKVHAKEYVTKDPLPTFRICVWFSSFALQTLRQRTTGEILPSVPVVVGLEGTLDRYIEVR